MPNFPESTKQPQGDHLPSLHLFAENPENGSYTDLEFIQKFKEANQQLLDAAIEAISPWGMQSNSDAHATGPKAPAGLAYLQRRLFELCDAANSNMILFNSPTNETLGLEIIHHFAKLAAGQKRILIIDCRLREREGSGDRDFGLSDYVSGMKGLEEIVCKADVKNVFCIGAGRAEANPIQALMSNRFLQLMELLKRQFDLILLNSPPYRREIDTFVLAKFLRPILVLALKGESWNDVKDIRKELAILDLKILGLIDNR
jgi:hypothetical protein